jgi:hypothetical protein
MCGLRLLRSIFLERKFRVRTKECSKKMEALCEGQDNVLMAVRLHFKECTDDRIREGPELMWELKRMRMDQYEIEQKRQEDMTRLGQQRHRERAEERAGRERLEQQRLQERAKLTLQVEELCELNEGLVLKENEQGQTCGDAEPAEPEDGKKYGTPMLRKGLHMCVHSHDLTAPR